MQRNLRSVRVGVIDFEIVFLSADEHRTESVKCYLAPVGEQFQLREIVQKHWKGSRKHERAQVSEGPLLDSEEAGLQALAVRYREVLATSERYDNTLLGYLKLSE